ncbi:mRNA-binding ribosome synthesis protein nop7 [Elasticomyces elasticus]|uniref:Pescadillo homolog n=1 Tax=Exophiala sideris TaxID=1016849 RepID=A0ABR0J4A5_9EURO|nr:mRNA-binding ribosome synthesis protein nop7 [Elasticomyces elasticus]KAK5027301.1 mRNA-binding ribosome synthesis protein nop7 [Exophiala sideris]KAK5034997.1 mRNA-binding ribosome synthesis protein nop7 [Exophiala sideris]KAK5056269.1 mRNA-binding ribosome synthesis protein nop7 [Exophiala sideris]KAK5181242.1 mRNA-binding ribosome synthesis protein nop7 [Eurotiomycetes sp. CCFEE 6388]
MAKIKKKGQSGQAKNYITRTQAVRKLQISLPDFRRLCIFKGIYPREPRNIKKANKSATHSTTFYYTKDIQYLLHEPLLGKFRDQKSLSKKIARSLGRNEVQDAVRLEKHGMPKIKLDHIVRERYPTFVDALRDLDDALSLLFLFANLPSTTAVPAKVISRCQRLCHEFEHYLITTHSLRRSFLSIKGIYYQATIQGQDIMWLVPYKFVQRVTQDVDYRIMGTFVEFYCTLLGFVNYRLYTSVGLVYPPKFDVARDERGAELGAFTLEGRGITSAIDQEPEQKALTNGHAQAENSEAVQDQINKIAQNTDAHEEVKQDEPTEDQADAGTIDTFTPAAPEGDTLPQPDRTGDAASTLFSNCVFYISREAPRHPIEFLLRAFGCKRVGWDTVLGEGAFTHDETDPRITHQIVDRPAPAQPFPGLQGQENSKADQNLQVVKPGFIMPGRIYVQPQWVWDCVNEGKLLQTDIYAPGETLPPHLSPWVRPLSGQYDPRATLEEQELEGEAEEDEEEEETAEIDGLEDEEDEEDESEEEDEEVDAGGMDVAGSEDESEEDVDEVDAFGGFEDDAEGPVDSDIDEEAQHQKELEAEASGRPVPVTLSSEEAQKAKARQARKAAQRKKDEEIERQKLMMSNKKRKLFEKMQYSNAKRDTEAEKLRAKRRKVERAGKSKA